MLIINKLQDWNAFFTINILKFFLLSNPVNDLADYIRPNPVNDRADYIRPNPVNDRADYIRFKDQTKDLFRSINTITVLLQLEFHSLKVHLNCACSFHSVNYSYFFMQRSFSK